MTIEQIMETYSKGYDVMIDDGFNTWTPSGNDDGTHQMSWVDLHKQGSQ